jgi:hypothetical protein
VASTAVAGDGAALEHDFAGGEFEPEPAALIVVVVRREDAVADDRGAVDDREAALAGVLDAAVREFGPRLGLLESDALPALNRSGSCTRAVKRIISSAVPTAWIVVMTSILTSGSTLTITPGSMIRPVTLMSPVMQ